MKELLFSVTRKDLVIQPYKGSGKGGQHRNKTMSCCRIHHRDSGVTVQACEERDFHRNRAVAFKRLVKHPTFNNWRRQKARDIARGIDREKELESLVEDAMSAENIKVEVFDTEEKEWKEECSSSQSVEN